MYSLGRARTNDLISEPHHRLKGGYTLIELMVVVVIIGVVSTIVIVSQGAFTRSALLANAAYDIGLSIRTAQTYGISSRSLRVGQQFLPNTGYGIEFRNPSSFILFADTSPSAQENAGILDVPLTPKIQPGDKAYDPAEETPVQTSTLNNGITISNFCAMYYIPTTKVYCKSCAGIGQCTAVDALDIVFARPNTEAAFSILSGFIPISPFPQDATPLTQACIKITTPLSNTIPRYLKVTQLGQVAATSSCP